MPRKNREAPEVVKERVERAAMRLFAAQGAAAVSIKQIAAEVSMSSQAVLYHYGSRQALQDAVRARLVRVLGQWLERFASPDGLDFSHRGLTAIVMDLVRTEPWAAALILRELLGAWGQAEQELDQATVGWRSRIAEGLRMGQEQGMLRADVDTESWFDRIGLMLLCTLSFPMRPHPLPPGSEDERALRREVSECVRIAITSLFVDPGLWLRGPE